MEIKKVEAYKEEIEEYFLGSLTDGEYSLEIRIKNDYNMPNYKKGTLFEVKGYIKTRGGM